MFELSYYYFKISLIIGSTFVTAALLGVYRYQNLLIYPSGLNGARDVVDTPAQYNLAYEDITLKTKDSETLKGYLLLHDKNSALYTNKTVLILSPNAGNIGHFLPVVKYIYQQLRYNVLIYSYRGYGKSTGEPNEEGLKIDADTVMEFVANHSQLASSSIVCYGRSLGGAVSIYIASRYPDLIAGLILENTFLSVRKVIPHIFPVLGPFKQLCHQIWPSEQEILRIPESVSMLFLSGLDDEIVPPAHMRTLYELSRSQTKTWVEFPGAHHNDTIVQPKYWDFFYEFMRKITPVEK
ncbi:hypothetical protein OGAPHI_006462 [Ogataea philodendri]|uniref:AB hydrolase-1 domain-containing protein n=1 Tax=Ogataea philodendri TaxID=1378263 RepID=A0A9P8NY64_9ASCO|nr:uncharacterized protein OGAPHI_006462 [Ogataea philodendri]KAH3661614.1 hypothetical protein OGAPHI_006462 [Ogataea philodendri]